MNRFDEFNKAINKIKSSKTRGNKMNKFLEFISFEFDMGNIVFMPLDNFYLIRLIGITNYNNEDSWLLEFGWSNSNWPNSTIYFELFFFKMFKRMFKTYIECD